MKTLYLHIGTPKTATTAIQTFCRDNQTVLAQKGYYYPIFEYSFPRVGKYCNAHFLIAQLRDNDKNREYEQEQKIAEDGMEQLLQLFQRYNNIILSDERIWNGGFMDDTPCWKRLQEHILSKDITIKVIVYLRRQDEYLFSWWGQRIKAGRKQFSTMRWSEISNNLPYIQLDYFSVLEQIAEYVGKENIIVRIFDKNAFLSHSQGGSIYADFLNALHLEYTNEYKVTTENKNPSLTKNNIEIKRILNMLPELDSDGNEFFRNTMINLASAAPSDNRQGMFSKEESEQFLETYKKGNMRIAKEYLGREEDLFEYSYHADDQWSWNDDNLSTDIINFFGTTTLYLLREINSLRKQQETLKQQLNSMSNPAKFFAQKLSRKKKS